MASHTSFKNILGSIRAAPIEGVSPGEQHSRAESFTSPMSWRTLIIIGAKLSKLVVTVQSWVFLFCEREAQWEWLLSPEMLFNHSATNRLSWLLHSRIRR